MSDPVIVVKNLRKLFPVRQQSLFQREERFVHAVDDVSFDVKRGEVLALVGESGCGKSTLALTLQGLEKPTSGQIQINGQSLPDLNSKGLKQLRRQIQMIFQDPYESLNPMMSIGDIVMEPLQVHQLGKNRAERLETAAAALEDAGLKPATDYLNRLPHELSGGQRQRVVIASALALEPSILLADEPVSMLDVSIRAEILNLLLELRNSRQISILFITHDLGTVAYIADRIAVMYLGRIVEMGPSRQLLENPQHPYTRSLLSVVPVPNPRLRRERIILQGETPNPIDLPSGCRFHPRCPLAQPHCAQHDPLLRPVAPNQEAACHEVEPKTVF
ncbi:MAG: ABC transporter ATP-binding protein [Anaerolineales bacterium]|nr:ABC transporter ATP-binding protein [Anaerolineales bacterium]MCB0020280.1 ABC transporter ATP-binding protein [Anaerolineales bacterium]